MKGDKYMKNELESFLNDINVSKDRKLKIENLYKDNKYLETEKELKKYRTEYLNEVHYLEKKIETIDYFIYFMKKNEKESNNS